MANWGAEHHPEPLLQQPALPSDAGTDRPASLLRKFALISTSLRLCYRKLSKLGTVSTSSTSRLLHFAVDVARIFFYTLQSETKTQNHQ